jgi:hypothetical protein
MDILGRRKRAKEWPKDYRIRYAVSTWMKPGLNVKEKFFTSTNVEAALGQFRYMVKVGKINAKSEVLEIHVWDRFSQGWTKV